MMKRTDGKIQKIECGEHFLDAAIFRLVPFAMARFVLHIMFAAVSCILLPNHALSHSHGTLQKYLDNCQTNTQDGIQIREWMGRTGNNLHQLMTAFGIARAANRSYVDVSVANNKVNRQMMGRHFPKTEWSLSTAKKLRVVGDDNPPAIYTACADGKQGVFYKDNDMVPRAGKHYDCKFSFYQRCDTTIKEKRHIYLKQIRPMLQPSVFTLCTPESGEDTLVIHIRDGDVNDEYLIAHKSIAQSHPQPPCAYFHQIINGGRRGGKPFRKVRLIHSGETPINRCIDDIKQLHPDKIVTDAPSVKQSIARDTCLLLTARNVAVTRSSFGITAMMMSTAVRRVFVVDTTNFADKAQHKAANRMGGNFMVNFTQPV